MNFSKIFVLIFLLCFLTSKEILEELTSSRDIEYSIDDFNVPITKENCTIVIESLKKLFKEGYIYTDIKKSPPNKEYFGALDIIAELDAIETNDRKYYDFFRDIKRILGKIKDGHLNIAAYISPNGYQLQLMTMCLPFQFYIEGENKNNAKLYIKRYDDCFDYFDDYVKEFVLEHEGKFLTQINNTDPFNFIQKINIEFSAFYNKHSTFTYNMKSAHKISIYSNPLSKEQLSNITFVFEDGKNITLDYYLYYKNSKLEENKEFLDFYNKKIQQNKLLYNPDLSILDIEDEFNNMKYNLKENKENTIEWDYSSADGQIKCRVDKNNSLNVFVQNSFSFTGESYINGKEIIENCTELFYSNDYQIVGIESYNGGGTCKISYYFQELLQVKILPQAHYSTLKSQLMKEYVESNISDITDDADMYQRIDIETCKPFNKFDDMKEIEDDYGDGVKHKRTQYFRVFNSSDLKEHKKIREKYFKLDKLKSPTDIIIFTDSFSYSATSFFIKGLQETGSAITVGYYGNPKEEDEPMDASQSPSFVGNFKNTDIYQNLKNAGFEIRGVTIYESYNYTYQNENPTPREYLIHPVDEKFELYKPYSDDLYDTFIQKAKILFRKYNIDGFCNPDNLDLLFDPNNKKDCYYFEGDEHAHGGYECDKERKAWGKNCKPYYCDIGYYFDKVKNKCIKDICTEGDDKHDEGHAIMWNKIISILYLLIILW